MLVNKKAFDPKKLSDSAYGKKCADNVLGPPAPGRATSAP